MTTAVSAPAFVGHRVGATDAVVYDVATVGSFTLCLDGRRYPAPTGEWMRVYFGATHSPHDFEVDLVAAPIVNRVRLGGYAVIQASALLEYLEQRRAEPTRVRGAWTLLIVRRAGEPGSHRLTDEVPDATRDRTALLVASLVEDYLGRGDYFDLVRSFDLASAVSRLRTHERRIAELREELGRAELELARELELADRQLALVEEEQGESAGVRSGEVGQGHSGATG